MSKKLFSKEDIEVLKNNKFVKCVSDKAITYSEEFKQIFVQEYLKHIPARIIFETYGFDTDMLGDDRLQSCVKRWGKKYKESGNIGLVDTRSRNSGRSLKRELTLEEEIERLRAHNLLLQAENELLKKLEAKESVVINNRTIKLKSHEKFLLIRDTLVKFSIKNMVRFLCRVAGVSRSGYYNYFSKHSQKVRKQYEKRDRKLKEMILKAYKFKNRKKGAKQIKMTLAKQFKVIYNLKRIRRIMKKYDIFCPIRKANPYRRMLKATAEHQVVANRLNREFKQGLPGKVLLTDITYLTYGSHKRAYLSTIQDASTNEILAYNVSISLALPLVTQTIESLMSSKKRLLTKDSFIHSDQGAHYTSPKFQKLIKQYKLGQSMSRRGNCWDNAPQESFFGHFKDETNFKQCQSFSMLVAEIDDYIEYYNNYRYQWTLKKMTPVEYRNHLLNVA
jgi:transposase InsO family protein